jgi:pyruvate/2-oxoglutarate dehydrogenase complex dihydrolipoamide dehydrogenase (E3) component/DNA-directed RNA polymerase subunit M/transcription elongation factor TFIIS
MAERFDAIVIGAGEAGAVVASRAVAAGRRVAMVHRAPYGSTCVNVGCVPSKFLIHRANVAHAVRTAGRFHVDGHGEPALDLAAIVADKNALVGEHRAEALGNARRAAALTLVEGEARFVSAREVGVGERRFTAERIFIATGMRPLIPDLPGIGEVEVHTNETVMELTEVPDHILVLGGGYIGCELGQAYRRFGSQVTIIHGPELLCADEEPDVSRLLGRGLRADGIELVTEHRAVRVERAGNGVRIMARAVDGSERSIEGSHLLVAGGRQPNTDTLDLDAAAVATRPDGSVIVDDRLRTNVPGLWAVGDVNGEQPFTRICQEEAKVAYADAFGALDVRIDRLSLGHGIFTDPEIGSVGMTEAAARAAGHDVAVGLVTYDKVEKAELIGAELGFIKFVVERQSRRLLGCHVIGRHAADLVWTAAVVLRRRGTLDELATAVGIFPTLAEGMEGTARGLVRRLAPGAVAGPLATMPMTDQAEEVTMTASNITCPACGAEFDVRERLEQEKSSDETPEPDQSEVTPSAPEPGSFQCPACGADFETEEQLQESES